MDIFLELVKNLWSSMTVTTFLQTAAIIIFLTYFLVSFLLKKKKEGGFSAIFKDEEQDAIRDKLINIEEMTSKLLILVEQTHDDSYDAVKDANEAVKDQSDQYNTLRRDIELSRTEMISELDDVKQWFKLHDQNVVQSSQSLKDLLQRVLDGLARMTTQIEKMDEFCRTNMSEFKDDNREITKGINELSKDIALIERTIQTQVSSADIKLR